MPGMELDRIDRALWWTILRVLRDGLSSSRAVRVDHWTYDTA
jgi:hypothetical protein